MIRRLSLSIGVIQLFRNRSVLGVGSVPWLSPLPGANGSRVTNSMRVGITHLGRSRPRCVPSVLCKSCRVLVLLSVSRVVIMQVISRRLFRVRNVRIVILSIVLRRSRCVLTLSSLTWKL